MSAKYTRKWVTTGRVPYGDDSEYISDAPAIAWPYFHRLGQDRKYLLFSRFLRRKQRPVAANTKAILTWGSPWQNEEKQSSPRGMIWLTYLLP